MKVAIYARVSTRDKDQNPDTQLYPLRQYAQEQGWETQEYVDAASALDQRGRVAWRRLLLDAMSRKFSIVLVLRLDRAFRSVADMYEVLGQWEMTETKLVSLKESLDSNTAAGKFMFNILASLAQFELELTRERIYEGLARAKAQGKHLGRPPGAKDKKPRRKSGYRLREALKARAKGK